MCEKSFMASRDSRMKKKTSQKISRCPVLATKMSRKHSCDGRDNACPITNTRALLSDNSIQISSRMSEIGFCAVLESLLDRRHGQASGRFIPQIPAQIFCASSIAEQRHWA
jgi:hypothetical protein